MRSSPWGKSASHISKAAILEQTTDNLLREEALKLLEQEADDLHPDQQDLLTTEAFYIIQLSKEYRIPPRKLLMTLPSSDYTQLRAASIVEQARDRIHQAQIEKKRKRSKTGKGSQG